MSEEAKAGGSSPPFRGFYHMTQAWYASARPPPARHKDEVMFGLYHHGGGTSGEMAMRWYEQGGRTVARLECYYDAFAVLAGCDDVLGRLAEAGNVTPGEFCELLLACGFVDLTRRERGV